MRLHTLEVTAFGPFAGTETVDFDVLNEAGLFLLTGATGAGKTSILDAVCFALYGVVPGVRGVKGLKSQHSDELARPEVVLDFGVRGRRFLVRRSPEWSRPKRRGTGTRVEKAAASLAEVVDGEEQFLTSRAAEVGLQVSSLVGMQAGQFQQVAMLPQGEFQRFLQASSQDRHDVLQHLFRTDRFARIESWVQDRSRDLRDRAVGQEQTVQRLVDAVAERAGTEPPETLQPGRLGAAADADTVLPWADDLVAAARERLDAAAARHQVAVAGAAAARTRLEAARLRERLVERRRVALDELASLEESSAEADRARLLLDSDTRASACAPVLVLLDQAELALTPARRHEGEVRSRSVVDLEPVGLAVDGGTEELQRAGRSTDRLLGQVRDLLPRARGSVEDARQVTAWERRLDAIANELAVLAEAGARLPKERDGLRAELEDLTTTAARHEALHLQLERAARRLRAVEELPAARDRLAASEEAVREARDAAADARELVQDLTERRLAGMAAELAGDLEEGHPCQVCGSTEHPARAVPADAAVTVEEQRAAQSAYDLAQQRRLDTADRAAAAARQVGALEEQTDGMDRASCRVEVTALEEELAAAAAAREATTGLTARLASVESELARGQARSAELATEEATTRQSIEARRAALAEDRSAVEALLGEGADPVDLPDHERRLVAASACLEELAAAVEELDRAQRRRDRLAEEATRVAEQHGFDTVGAARGAVLEAGTRSALTTLLTERTEALARVDAVLRDDQVNGVTGVEIGPATDVPAAAAACAQSEVEADDAARAFHRAEQALSALAGLRIRLEESLTTWQPLRNSSTRAESMSKLVRGMGSDNQLQMRLSAYVLAQRLDQVLDAANERLAHMRDQRYLLSRTGRASRRTGQAGLGLEVLDQWTGDVRDPATLSGGETFVVSLALALGLADVVTQEAGGTEVETLFVDEGFGTLDPETLDDVMDRLDGLRAGGRTVGVVSHVNELRTRIPHQLHVHKSPRGSSVRMTTAVG